MDTASRALTDDLTKAYNRRFFSEQMNRLFQQARDEQGSFSLVMFDLDYFKQYNDINGHIQGDIALIETVRILHAVCSLDSAVCRYGGEEFMVLLPGHPLREARRTAENIRQAVYDYRYFNEQALPGGRLSASLGVTSYRPGVASAQQMAGEADSAMYRAKNNGRNRVELFPGVEGFS
jgi:diguanylate cyclase (GGDEF)-like protein